MPIFLNNINILVYSHQYLVEFTINTCSIIWDYFSYATLYISLFLILLFPRPGICINEGALAFSASPSNSFLSGGIIKNIMYVSAKIHSYLELKVDHQVIEWILYDPLDYETTFTSFSLNANKSLIMTVNGIENLKPSLELNREKGITIPDEAANSQIGVMYAISPLFTEFLRPEDINNRSFLIPLAEEDNQKFEINQKIKVIKWDSKEKVGTYPHIWHEDPEGFIITITINP